MTRKQNVIRKRAKEMVKDIRSTKSMKRSEREIEAAKILANSEKDIQILEIQKTGNGIPKDAYCIICEKRINTGDYRILGFKDGLEIYRHECCAPGSIKWMKSKIGQASSYRKYFKEETEGGMDDD